MAVYINPVRATKAPPGSRQKVRVLVARARAFLPLFVDGDATSFCPNGRAKKWRPVEGESERVLEENFRRYMESVGCV